jgi:hypothetical protein
MDNTFINRRWLVIPSTIVELIDFNQILETSVESLRFSIDGSKTFIKYEVNEVLETYTTTNINPETGETITNTIEAGIYGRPSIYSTEYTEYKHSEILELLQTSDWTNPIQI